ncbi:SIMPL domain-containing protein [Pollutimonas bauzanensis]|uniref:Predicted secreted protein n=1 Tax=Pollutimonas bauzanensis TaxID=658167 RepID=A0A1M5ZHN0_9BURK|nr:SIMPL domain-containing protein [Pollutimonas bauzanensis]SHI23766.1 Predicted secreted protein [Pollutimonas bauzanensis]
MYLSKQKRKWLSGIALCVGAGALVLPVSAQQVQDGSPRGGKWPQASLRAEASAEIAQDTVKVTLASEISEASQAAVAQALSKTLEGVMTEAKGDPKVKASSGNYRVWPMSNEKGKITNWRGRGEIILESADFAAASELAGKLSDRMPIANLAFSVSPQARAKQEQALLAQAVRAFGVRAQALTDAFGFARYTIRNIELSGAGAQYQPAPRMMAMAADKASAPLEGGSETVSVSIQGSIFLHTTQK